MKRIFGKRLLVLLIGLLLLAGAWRLLPVFRVWQARHALLYDLDRAEVLIAAMVNQSPIGRQAQLLHSQMLRRRGRWQESQRALDLAKRLGLDEEDARHEQLLLSCFLEFKIIEPVLRAELEQHPRDLDIVQVLAEAYCRFKKSRRAREMFERWEKLAPWQPELYFQRGLLHKAETRYHRAAMDFRTFLQHYPEHVQARLLLGDCLLGDGKPEEAAVEFESCRKRQPDNPDALAGLAGCTLDKNPEEARALLTGVLQLQPNRIGTLLDLAKLDMLELKIDDAIARFEKVISLKEDAKQAHFSLAQCYRRKGESAKAVLHERRFQELDLLQNPAKGSKMN